MSINLTELFEVQWKLDVEIERKHPIQLKEDREAKKILALLTEIGELSNEWRGFKFWSNDQRARTYERKYNKGDGVAYTNYNPLLEEYVDCLHFILSIGLGKKCKEELECNFNFDENDIKPHKYNDITIQFIWLINTVSRIFAFGTDEYDIAILEFIGLGEMLGFTWEQVTDAYMSKNATNWERQANGY